MTRARTLQIAGIVAAVTLVAACRAVADLGDVTLVTADASLPADALAPADEAAVDAGPTVPVAIAAGVAHACAVLSDGRVKCWGWNASGQLGTGDTTDLLGPKVAAVGIRGATAVVAGNTSSCAKVGTGIQCWGDNAYGELGQDTVSVQPFPFPAPVKNLTSGVTSLCAAGFHYCAVLASRTAVCWGSGASGELGNGSDKDKGAPVDVPLDRVLEIGCGGKSSCAITMNSGVNCWGNNASGQLGDGTTVARLSPTPVQGLPGVLKNVAVGGAHACGILTPSGDVVCWGLNSSGQLGDGTTNDSKAPVAVKGLPGPVRDIACGAAHCCAITLTNEAHCWGANTAGQLGTSDRVQHSSAVPVVGIGAEVTTIAAGSGFTCAVVSSGSVKCWGDNQRGQVGDTTTQERREPTTVVGLLP